MAQVTLDGLSREHGKGIDMKSLAVVREQLLDLKIRMKTEEEDKPVPLQQDIRTDRLPAGVRGIYREAAALREAEGVRCVSRA